MTTRAAGNDPTNPSITLFEQVQSELSGIFAAMEWADDEIVRASTRHPDAADTLHHAFGLLHTRAIGPGMGTELVYRAHARELLDRVVTGADTRPATATEICLACSEISLRGPMHDAATGLYFRMWLSAFPDRPITETQADDQQAYQRLHGAEIDELEAQMRRKLADPSRLLGDIDCAGRHNGEPVDCRYTRHQPA